MIWVWGALLVLNGVLGVAFGLNHNTSNMNYHTAMCVLWLIVMRQEVIMKRLS